MKNKKRLSLSDIDKKLDRLIGLEKKELFEESKLERNEKIFTKKEEEVINQIEKLEHTERNIRKEIGQHPLKKLSYKDAGKSMVGAFVGLLSHFAVLEGVKFAEEITLRRATFLYFVSLLIAIIVFYYTGFRSIKDVKILALLPIRVMLVYVVTLITILFVLFIIGKLDGINILQGYKIISVLTMPAIIGACVADLIGGD